MTTPTTVEFYWRPGCPFCISLRRRLTRAGLPLVFHDIWGDPDAAAFVRSVAAGNETVPTVVVAGHALVNPHARDVEELIAHEDPDLLASLPVQRPRRFLRRRRPADP